MLQISFVLNWCHFAQPPPKVSNYTHIILGPLNRQQCHILHQYSYRHKVKFGHAVAKHPSCILTGIITASVGCTIILTVTNYDEGACFARSLLLHLHATLLERRWSVYLMKIVIPSNSSCALMRFDAHVLMVSSWGGRLITHTCNLFQCNDVTSLILARVHTI